ELPRKGRDLFDVCVHALDRTVNRPLPDVEIDELVAAFQEVLRKAALVKHHHVQLDTLSVREQMVNILSKISSKGFLHFSDCFDLNEGRLGVVVSFIAILELVRESMIDVVQAELFAPIYIRARKDD
ncbi:MAG: segregation/condensation protein A, partial [Gammaproteobacteria bacterium]|nr:segregation/condensation protein A [Gammaproteobacteria bacterium]